MSAQLSFPLQVVNLILYGFADRFVVFAPGSVLEVEGRDITL
uniref:Uncharacterized protein n=1 Tax=Cyanothece sp. (strain PCC 7425 / ATCC 29141) TaxID=395961 RepID=B8HZ97_CYAP4